MDLILIVLIILLVVGVPTGWRCGGPPWGGGIAGLLLLILLLYLLLGHARAAEAQGLVCASAEQFDAGIKGKFQEERVFVGMAGDNILILYLNQETGSWTLARTMGPMICVLGGGFKSKVLLPIHAGEPS